MTTEFNFGELASDESYVRTVNSLQEHIQQCTEMISQAEEMKKSDKLSKGDQIELDTFLTFALNSLYWVYLRLQGEHPQKHPIKDEVLRLKNLMKRYQDAIESEKLRPTLDAEAARRFIKHGVGGWPSQVAIASTNQEATAPTSHNEELIESTHQEDESVASHENEMVTSKKSKRSKKMSIDIDNPSRPNKIIKFQ